ncbi:MAG: hypothetical protein IIU21_01630 [Schwartzia sp.]|jgi:hypothetical protein|nr:hypothetical protein [Schwartzia sp. (in: firmicutes)]
MNCGVRATTKELPKETYKIIAGCLAGGILLIFLLLITGSLGDDGGTRPGTVVVCLAVMGGMGYLARFYWLYEEPDMESLPAPELPERPKMSFHVGRLAYDRNLVFESVETLLALAEQQADKDKLLSYSYYKAALDNAVEKNDRWNVLFQLASALDRDNSAEAMTYAHQSLGYAQSPQQVGGSFGLIGLMHWKNGEYREAYDCAVKEAEQFAEVNQDIRFYEKQFSATAKAGDCQWAIYQSAPPLSPLRQEAWQIARVTFDKALSLANYRGLWDVPLHYGSTCRYLARLCEFMAYTMRMQESEYKALEWERRAGKYIKNPRISEAELESALARQEY